MDPDLRGGGHSSPRLEISVGSPATASCPQVNRRKSDVTVGQYAHPQCLQTVDPHLVDTIFCQNARLVIFLSLQGDFVLKNLFLFQELLSNPRNSTKGPQYKYMEDVLGGGILSGSGK